MTCARLAAASAAALLAVFVASASPAPAHAHGGLVVLRTVAGPYRIDVTVSRDGNLIDETVRVMDAQTRQPVPGTVLLTLRSAGGETLGPFLARGRGGAFEVRYPPPPDGDWQVVISVQGALGAAEIEHRFQAPAKEWRLTGGRIGLALNVLALMLILGAPIAAWRWWLQPPEAAARNATKEGA